jgi:hypothetical protein
MPTRKTQMSQGIWAFFFQFSGSDFNRYQTPKMPCGWDLNLNNRLFRGDFEIASS